MTTAPTLDVPAEPLANLRREHPRLLARPGIFEAIVPLAERDAFAARCFEAVHARAEVILREPVSPYEIPDGKRLLATSRRVVTRVYHLALMHRVTGEHRYLDRCWAELDAAANFKDWNPSHFLDTAEMTHAFAIAYDWLHDAWSAAQRDAIEQAIVTHGFTPGLAAYDGHPVHHDFPNAFNNWNQVCNGGLSLGALALAERRPDEAAQILRGALASLPKAMCHLVPDGGWDEGPNYWAYATRYTVPLLAALHTALGEDFGLSDYPGLAETGLFPIYMAGPTDRNFNFSDCPESVPVQPEMLWLARRYNLPAAAAFRKRRDRKHHPLDLVWMVPDAALIGQRDHLDALAGDDDDIADLPLDRHFKSAEVVTMRTTWHDERASFVGFGAVDNKAGHPMLDQGSFVFDALGQRWAFVFDKDDYNLPGYFDVKHQRWSYYRTRAEGHNTLVVNPGDAPDQDPRAAASIEKVTATPDSAAAVADLSEAYAHAARSVKRGVALVAGRRALLVQDEIELDEPCELWWFMHTHALVELGDDGRSATLTQAGERVTAALLTPEDARLEVMPAAPLPTWPTPERQASNDDARKLAIHLPAFVGGRLRVLLSPGGLELEVPERGLDQW